MGRRAILQIGTEKTGTTTLQHFLAANRAPLARNGFLYPEFCGQLNHTGLAAFALDPAKRDPIRAAFGVATEADLAPMRARLRTAASAELKGSATAIFCNEHCHSRLTTAAELTTLRDFLRQFFDDIQISVYLRRQDQVALSLYSTRLKSGEADQRILPRTDGADPYFNYDRSLALWEDCFGRENMHVRLFDRRTLTDGSIVNDFVAMWGLGEMPDFVPVIDQNESIQPVAQEFLRRVNPRLQPLSRLPIEDVRGPLAGTLEMHYPGRGVRPARAEAQAFYSAFRVSNEVVRQRYFPDRAILFDEDFESYPELEDERVFSLDDMAEVAAKLHMSATRERRRLLSEIAIRDARLHWTRSEPEAAEQAIRRAIAWHPDHPDAYRTLAEFMLRLERIGEAVAAARRATECRPDIYEYWHFLGILLRRGEDFGGAADAQARALELNPGHTASRHELEQVLIRRADAEARAQTAGQPRTNGSATWHSSVSH